MAELPLAVADPRDIQAVDEVRRLTGCKVNLVLNILGKRADGFHELETLMHPVRLFDRLTLDRAGSTVQLSCSEPSLPVDSRNLVYRAAAAFLEKVKQARGH